MTHFKCPHCKNQISNEKVNIKSNMVTCYGCGYYIRKPRILKIQNELPSLDETPNGSWIKKEHNKIIIGAYRTNNIWVFGLPFTIILFIVTFTILNDTNGFKEYPIVFTLLSLFLISMALLFGYVSLNGIIGKIEIKIDEEKGEIFSGIGKIGVKKLFYWSNVDSIYELYNRKYHGLRSGTIKIKGKHNISFSYGIPGNLRNFLCNYLVTILYRRKNK